MHANLCGFEHFFTDTCSTELDGICIKDQTIPSFLWNANAIISTLYRAEIADNHQFFSVIINPSECNDALLVVIMRNPAKALPGIIILPKLRMFQIKS